MKLINTEARTLGSTGCLRSESIAIWEGRMPAEPATALMILMYDDVFQGAHMDYSWHFLTVVHL